MSLYLWLFIACVSVCNCLASLDEARDILDDLTAKSPFVTFGDEDVWKVQIGDICQLTRLPLPSSEPDKFLECLKPNQTFEEWPWTDKGLWVLKECVNGTEFYPITHSCTSKRYIRRQQGLCQTSNPPPSYCAQPSAQPIAIQPIQQQMSCQCPQNVQNCVCPQPQQSFIQPTAIPQPSFNQFCQQQPQNSLCQQCQNQNQNNCPPSQPNCGQMQNNCPPSQPNCGQMQNNCPPSQPNCPPVQNNCMMPPQPCPLASGGASNAQVGGVCSWMLAPLAADPSSPKNYLQCQPAQGNFLCGRWVCLPCAPGTIFDVSSQVCANDPNNMPSMNMPRYQGNQNQNQNCACGCQSGQTNIGQCNNQNQCPGQSTCQPPVPQQSYNGNNNCQQACGNSQPVCCYNGSGMGKKK